MTDREAVQPFVEGRPQPEKCVHRVRLTREFPIGTQVCGPDHEGKTWECPLVVLVPLEDYDLCIEGPLECQSKQSEITVCRAYDIECGLVDGECVRNPRKGLVRIRTDKCKGEGEGDHPKHRKLPTPRSGMQ